MAINNIQVKNNVAYFTRIFIWQFKIPQNIMLYNECLNHQEYKRYDDYSSL